jgi:hypothetical protein
MTDQRNEVEAAELSHVLEQELMSLTRYWKTFLYMYGESEERVELLASVGSDFFETVHFALRDAIIMGVGRLLDKRGSGNRKNASFLRLVKGLGETVEESTIKKAEGLLDKIKFLAEPITDARNKRIGHSDIDTIEGSYEVSPLLVDDVEKCLQLMQDLLNTVSKALAGYTTDYDTIQFGSADIVLGYLKRGFEADQREALRFRRRARERNEPLKEGDILVFDRGFGRFLRGQMGITKDIVSQEQYTFTPCQEIGGL